MGERIVEVEWIDSSATHGWHNDSQHPRLSPCRSVGFVLRDDDEQILLAESLDETDPDPTTTIARFGCVTVIPRCAVKKVRDLGRKRK